jgi:hypothetical protein
MKTLLQSIDGMIVNGNWYGALFVSLTIPDILGKAQYPDLSSSRRYATWFNDNVADKYTINGNIFLNGNDCYAFRCSALHEGNEVIEHQRARDIITKFNLRKPQVGMHIHNNLFNGVLQLQVDIFCSDIVDSAKRYIETNNVELGLKIREMNFFHDPNFFN